MKGKTMEPEEALSLILARRRAQHGENGVALITTLLLLMLLTGMVVAMVTAVNSDMLINGYYGNFRGAFYAADSGLAIIRQDMQDKFLLAIPISSPVGTQPIPAGTEGAILAYLVNTYGSTYKSINAGQSWPATFSLDTAIPSDQPSVSVQCTPTPADAGATCAAPCPTGCLIAATTPTQYAYVYNYHFLVSGRAGGAQQTILEETGNMTLKVTVAPTGPTQTPFAAWGMFMDQGPICDGSYLVAGTISGPVFTNGAWNFSDAGQNIFTDSVGSNSAKAGYQFSNGHCDEVAGVSDKNGGVTIAPTFKIAPKWGQPKVVLPTDSYNQQRAVLDSIGTAGQPSDTDRHNAQLRNASQTQYSSGGQSSGVWLPYTITAGVPTFTGGGILVEGDASVQLSTNGASQQIYTIKQGSTTTIITIDDVANTTVFKTGGTTVSISGVPVQKDPNTGLVIKDATMLYVDGNITGLSGPGAGLPAVQDGTALTITAYSGVTITGDILYKTEPVTQTQNQIPGTPADTLIPGNDKGQYLGIFTAGGDINLANSQSSNNLEIDASCATLAAGGSGGIINNGNDINTLNIVGGRIQNQIKNIKTTTRNVFFDRRYANGAAPPWFPSTSISNPGVDGNTPTPPKFQRLSWVNQSAFQ